MPFADLQHGPLHYETWGAGPPLVLLLPVSRGPEGLGPLILVLSGTLTVIRYDQRGYGESPAADGRDPSLGPVPLSARASEVLELLDHLGIDAANLLAHSTGCGVALEMVAAAPGRVGSLTLVSPWSHADTELRTIQNLRVAAARAMGAVDYATYNASLLFPPWYRRRFAKGFKAMAEAATASPQDADFIQNGLIPILELDGREIAKQVVCPTQILAARDDQLMPPWHGETLAGLIGGSGHELLETGGHMLLETQREIIADRVTALVAKGRRGGQETGSMALPDLTEEPQPVLPQHAADAGL